VPKYKVGILTPAAKDIERIAEYHLRMVGPQSAEKITDKLLDTIQILEEQPFSGSEHPDEILRKQNFRKLICGDYVCVYKVIEENVFVYRVVHGASDYPKLFK
jgi:plasmid stabilization system protein ParE